MKRILSSLVTLLLWCGASTYVFAAVAVNGTPVQNNPGAAGTTNTFSYTVAAGSSALVCVEGSGLFAGGTPPVHPATVTYNSVSLTEVTGSGVSDGNHSSASIWYLISPTTGSSLTILATYGTSVDVTSLICFGLSGVNTSSPVGTPVTNSSGGTAGPATVTATGGSSGDLYIGDLFAGVEGGTATSSQTNLATTTPRGSWVDSADSAAGSGSGAFSWSFSTGQDGYAAVGVPFKASGASTPPAGMFLVQ